MSWGYRILILTLGFVGFMTFMVISAFRQNFDLVAEDYYAKEIRFQDQIEKEANQQALKEPLMCIVIDENVVIKFPSEFADKSIEGEVLFFNPADAGKDFKVNIKTLHGGVYTLNKALLKKGFYHVQIDYSVVGKQYYAEKTLKIQ